MNANIYMAIKGIIAEMLEGIEFELLGLEEGEKVDSSTGEIQKQLKVHVEIPRGYDKRFSKSQIVVKIPKGRMKIKPELIDEEMPIVRFDNLAISYIDGKSNVYFVADDYEIVKEG